MKRVVAPTLLAVLFGSLLVQLPIALAERTSAYEWFDPILDIRKILLDSFVTEPDEEKWQQAIIDSMIASLDDPYTVYVPQQDTSDFQKDLRGEYVGIGAEVNTENDFLTIVSPMDDSPALKAGIMAGDIVLEIDGQSTSEKSVTDCIDMLKGKPGTQVRLLVRHLDGTEEELLVTRDYITTRTVKGLRRNGEDWDYCADEQRNIEYVRVTQFNPGTIEEFRSTLDRLQDEGMRGLVLDLRDNPGGSLSAAVAMSDMFLDSGEIVSVKGRDTESRVFSANSDGTLPHFPMIVLINRSSASASEIVAGALQENDRAKVIGTRSYGKGSVQEVRTLPYNMGTLKFTTAHYYMPSGRNIHRMEDSSVWGVDPDPGFVVSVTSEQYMERWRARRDFEVIREGNGHDDTCVTVDWVRHDMKDEQLAMAIEALGMFVDTGEWKPISEEGSSEVAFSSELDDLVSLRERYLSQLDRIEEQIRETNDQLADAGAPPLLPEDLDLRDGTLEIRDKFGNIIGTYTINGGDMELALSSVRLTPINRSE